MENCRFCEFLYITIVVYFTSCRDRYVSKTHLHRLGVSSRFVCIRLMGMSASSLHRVYRLSDTCMYFTPTTQAYLISWYITSNTSKIALLLRVKTAYVYARAQIKMGKTCVMRSTGYNKAAAAYVVVMVSQHRSSGKGY